MTYDETLRYLYASAPLFQQIGAGAYKEGLETTRTLDAHFGHPHRKYLTIHIGGTNGKGTCSHSVAAVLQAAGYRVGLYTSPHLVDFRERIRVDGVPMPEAYVVDFVARERSFFEPLRPSFFELTTAMAFKYFADAAVDIAIVEVGLGGRLDCTNIVQPVLSVVTNISLDHTQFLGHTLAAIAGEKAGIFKAGTPAVVGEATPETRPVFTDAAARVGASLVFAEDAPEVLAVSRDAADEWRFESRTFGSVRSSLTGAYQERNMNTLLTALRDVLNLHDDYSMQASLRQIEAVRAPINPAFEQALKGNAENSYCRSYISELFDYYYLPEFDHYRREIERELRSSSRRLTYDAGRMEMQPIVDAFYEKPLDEMRPLNPRPRTREEFRRQIGTLAARLQRM